MQQHNLGYAIAADKGGAAEDVRSIVDQGLVEGLPAQLCLGRAGEDHLHSRMWAINQLNALSHHAATPGLASLQLEHGSGSHVGIHACMMLAELSTASCFGWKQAQGSAVSQAGGAHRSLDGRAALADAQDVHICRRHMGGLSHLLLECSHKPRCKLLILRTT